MKTLLATFAAAVLFAAAATQIHATAFPRDQVALLLLIFAAAVFTALVALRFERRHRAPDADRTGRAAPARRDTRADRKTTSPRRASPQRTDAKRERGTVKWFDRNKGYGFVVRADGSEIFVHFRSVRRSGDERPLLADGQAVTFVAAKRQRGWQAEDVVPC